MIPKHLRYTKEHEWVAVEGGTGTMGITDFAQHQLGDIVYVELPEVGRTVKAGETLGTIESVKAVSEIYSPVSGEVVEVNGAIEGDPSVVNKDPYGAGWMVKLKMKNPAELDELLGPADYAAHIGQ